MAFDVERAKEVLRLDNDHSDEILLPLVLAIPSYIEATTGLTPEEQVDVPLVDTISGFIITLWYNPEGTDAEQLTRTIESLLKTLSIIKKKT